MSINDKVRTKIIYILKTKNISQRELAKISNLPVTTISNIIHNKIKSPTIETVEKIAKSNNMTLEEFFRD